MEKLKFKFKTLSNTEVDAKNYDLAIRKSLFGGHTFTLRDGNEIKYLKMESIRSVLTGKNETVLTDMADDHIVGIVENAFDENNIHNRSIISEIESDRPTKPVTPEEPDPEPAPSEPEQNPIEPLPPEDTPETSDEFTYEPTPGKISKIFLHLYDGNTLEDVTPSDSQITEVDGSHCYIDSDGVTRREFNLDKSSLKKIGDNTFDIVVAFDANITSDSNLKDIIDTIILDENAHTRIYEKIETDKNNYNNVYYAYTEDYNDYSSTLMPIESAEDVTKLLNALTNSVRGNCERREDRVFDSIYEYEPSGFHVMDSDKVICTNNFSVDYFDIFNTSADFNMYSNNVGGLLDKTEPDESVGFQGIYVIDKAIQQGRALDIGFDISTPQQFPIRSYHHSK